MKTHPRTYPISGMVEAEGVRAYSKENEKGTQSFCITDGVEFTFLSAEALLKAVRS